MDAACARLHRLMQAPAVKFLMVCVGLRIFGNEPAERISCKKTAAQLQERPKVMGI